MPFRNIVLALGALLVFAGIGLSLFWLSQMGGQNEAKLEAQPVQQAAPRREALLEAAQPLRAGTLIRPADLRWREIDASEARPGTVLRKDASENDYLGAIVTRDFAEGETLATAGLVKTTDRGFLSAVLKPGMRAVTIAVDVPQGAAGMVLPGDRVDVVLTQNLAGIASVANDPSRKSVAETVLTNVRVIAVDQRLNLLQTKPALPEAATEKETVQREPRMPRTVTLELDEAQAQKLFVAAQLGGLQLPVRPLEGAVEALPPQEAVQPAVAFRPAREATRPTWASDVSPALKLISQQTEAQQQAQTTLLKVQDELVKAKAALAQLEAQAKTANTPSTIEAYVRRPPLTN